MEGDDCLKQAYGCILRNDFEGAIRWFERAIAADPDNASYYYKCSISYSRSGKLDRALYYALRAVELDPEQKAYGYQLRTVQASLLVSSARFDLGQQPPDPASAIHTLQEAIELDPLSFDGFFLLGEAYALLNRLDDAVRCALEAIRLNPGDDSARTLFTDMSRKRRALRYRQQRRQRRRNR
ncbi:tetratricopeptide repeat protein [Paenibacillus sp. MMS18-CY102]|uniref:tetratricopeptide repeat protein n=1 Tax=Paenibacillus sp. MMS18-CY102 TaxID=2682849 RepID=UPI001366488A|nr:tetratricopeptide repeat protein [Paenibacillus sp. MMS18-CY102]